jgi:hypothetical protein
MAQRLELGEIERRVQRRPGIPGALICGVVLLVALTFLKNGPYNAWSNTYMGLSAVIVLWWGYVWFRRARGGLYIFDKGFIDAAGRRRIGVLWVNVRSIKVVETWYALGSVPTGSSVSYQLDVLIPPRADVFPWHLDSTYFGVTRVVESIAERSGVRIG